MRRRLTSGAIAARVTSGCSVTICTASGSTGTISCCSCGRTSRNQPIELTTTSKAPITLKPALVSRPAKSNVAPKARTTGHTVGSGSSTLDGRLAPRVPDSSCMIPSASYDVHDRKNHDPNRIDKVPIEPKHPDAAGMLLPNFGRKRQDQHEAKSDHSYDHVRSVQSDQRIIRGAE